MSEVELKPWERPPDPCWSCGGEAEARDDIHVRCIDSKGINCEVMDHWYTRKTWNTRTVPVATEAEQKCKEDSVHAAQNPSTLPSELGKTFQAVVGEIADSIVQKSRVMQNHVWTNDRDELTADIAQALTTAREAERERCAKIAEGLQHAYAVDVALKIAAAIRNPTTRCP